MIDIATETLLTPAQATMRLPQRRQNKRPNVATIFRWMQIGTNNVKLEFIMVGGTRCTSIEALQRFFDGLTARELSKEPPPAPLPKSRQREIKAAERRLAATTH